MNNHWSSEDNQRLAAWQAVAGLMKARHLLTETEAQHSSPWEIDFIKSTVGGASVRMADCDTLAEYTERMAAYIEKAYPPILGGTISVSMGEFTLTAVLDDDRSLATQTRAMHRRLQVALDGVVLQQSAAENNKPATTYEEHPAEILVHEFANGRPTFKVKGGPFGKWGVRIWPEVLIRAGFSPDTIALGETEISGTMKVLVDGGKARKVTELTVS